MANEILQSKQDKQNWGKAGEKILYRIINVFEFLHFQTNFSTNINNAAIVLNFVMFLEVFIVVFQLSINAL